MCRSGWLPFRAARPVALPPVDPAVVGVDGSPLFENEVKLDQEGKFEVGELPCRFPVLDEEAVESGAELEVEAREEGNESSYRGASLGDTIAR